MKPWYADPTIWTGLLAAIYLAVLPMADTIALRNVALLLLLIVLSWQFRFHYREIVVPWPFLAWGAYLLVFPLLATDYAVAWKSLEGQWGRGLLAMVVGAGTAFVLRDRKLGTAFQLGLVSSVSVLVFLGLAGWKTVETGAIPWGYWGRETHHADLGYTASQATVLLSAVLLTQRGKRGWSIALIVAALIATALARSRAGLAFSIVGGGLVFLTALLTHTDARRRRWIGGGLALLLVGGASAIVIASKVDPRWGAMTDRLSAGFLGDALTVECEGTASIEKEVVIRYGEGARAKDIIDSVRDGDGGRVVLFRVGVLLALKHPWGIDGSRQAFQKLLRQECPAPVLQMAHAHNGWIDTMLAIGWLGALLYLAVLVHCAVQGAISLRATDEPNIWAIILVALSTFWMLRAMTDSVFRDHMFEMQGFVLSYALVALRKGSARATKLSDSPQ